MASLPSPFSVREVELCHLKRASYFTSCELIASGTIARIQNEYVALQLKATRTAISMK
jgi:hypothetical protein